ncbi:unnamed protein product, partial [Prorocentrum cordatum]
MPVCGTPDNLYVGRGYDRSSDDLRKLLQTASEAKFDFVVIPLFQGPPSGESYPSDGRYELVPSTSSDLALDSKTWSSAVVGTLSDWINPDLAPTPQKRDFCR